MTKVSRIWLWLSLILLGYAGGIVTGVVVDADQVYHTTVEKIKQKRSSGSSITIDVESQPDVKSKKEIRQEKREEKKEARAIRRETRKASKEIGMAAPAVSGQVDSVVLAPGPLLPNRL